ncbi:MAG: glycine/sarcosine/betaine reductase selenoprotein B family protein [Thermodesulfobacteriota bacterium]
MVKMSRRAVPFTPFEGELKKSVVALVSNAGVHLKEGEPFDPEGDTSLRVLPGEVTSDQLMVTHSHYDHADADRDINCVFPIDRLREVAQEGVIAGVSNKHVGLGYSMNLKETYEVTASQVADHIERSKADLVALTGG